MILQLINIIDQVNLDELGLRKQLKEEVDRYYKFQGILEIEKQKIETIDVDMRNYAKYVLKEGSVFEKRALLSHLKDRLIFTNKIVTLAK